MNLSCGVVHVVGETVQGTAGIATHGSRIAAAHAVRSPRDGCRVNAINEAKLHCGSHIGGLERRVTVVEEPRQCTLAALQVINLLISHAHGAQSHAQVDGHILIVLDKG